MSKFDCQCVQPCGLRRVTVSITKLCLKRCLKVTKLRKRAIWQNVANKVLNLNRQLCQIA
jgi:hypothetical protein